MQAFPHATPEEVSALLVATALPAALWMRGDLVLHAAAAVLPGKREALAFAGSSGSGKSRLLAILVEEEGSVVAEDSVCIRRSLGKTWFSGLPGCLFTREMGATLERERHLVTVPREQQLASAHVGGLVVLDRNAGPRPERLHGPQALVAILDSFHRPRVPRLLGMLPALLPRLAQFLSEVPVYRWRPEFNTSGVAALQALADELQADSLDHALPLI